MDYDSMRDMEHDRTIEERYEAKDTQTEEEALRDAIKALDSALESSNEIEFLIIQAAEEMDGLPISDQIYSIRNDLAEVWSSLRKMKKELEKGVA